MHCDPGNLMIKLTMCMDLKLPQNHPSNEHTLPSSDSICRLLTTYAHTVQAEAVTHTHTHTPLTDTLQLSVFFYFKCQTQGWHCPGAKTKVATALPKYITWLLGANFLLVANTCKKNIEYMLKQQQQNIHRPAVFLAKDVLDSLCQGEGLAGAIGPDD